MTKSESKATPSQSPPEPRADHGAEIRALTERFTPLEEFRERGERWMKEVTAQVARLAGGAEQDEKRRGAIDKRLADIEERIRSLLTLTELVSLDKNPFAAGSNGSGTAPAHVPAPEPASSPEQMEPAPITPDEDGSAPPAESENPGEAEIAGTDESEDEPQEAPVPATRSHPNDAAAEREPPAPPIRLSDEADGTEEESSMHATADAETRRRLLVVAWADLLASAEKDVDLPRFLGFYEEAEWVDAATARDVQRLLPHVENGHRPPQGARALHEATIRLLAEHDPQLPRFDSAEAPRSSDERPELEAR